MAERPPGLNRPRRRPTFRPKSPALLDSGKISSTGAAIQLEKLAQKNEAKADSLISQVEQLPEGEKLAKRTVEKVLSEEGGRRKKGAGSEGEAVPESLPAAPASAATARDNAAGVPWEEGEAVSGRSRINPGKVKMVATILGLADDDEEAVLARLIDEFLALKGEAGAR